MECGSQPETRLKVRRDWNNDQLCRKGERDGVREEVCVANE